MFETRSAIRGRGVGRGRVCGRGRHDSPLSTHGESPIQEEDREESHREEHVDSN